MTEPNPEALEYIARGVQAGLAVEKLFAGIETDGVKFFEKNEASKMKFIKLKANLGARGEYSSSLGKKKYSFYRNVKSNVQRSFEECFDDDELNKEFGKELRRLRKDAVEKAGNEKLFALEHCRGEMKKNPKLRVTYAQEREKIKDEIKRVQNDETSDIPDVESMCTTGWMPRQQLGDVYSGVQRKTKLGYTPCLNSFSRYAHNGELAAMQILEAADFVAGRRRRSPRKVESRIERSERSTSTRNADDYGALYGLCINTRGQFILEAGDEGLGAKLLAPYMVKTWAATTLNPTLLGFYFKDEASRLQWMTDVGNKVEEGESPFMTQFRIEESLDKQLEINNLPRPLSTPMDRGLLARPEGANGRYEEAMNTFSDQEVGEMTKKFQTFANDTTTNLYTQHNASFWDSVRGRGFRGAERLEAKAAGAERELAEATEKATAAAEPDRWFYKKWILPTVGWALRTGLISFFIVETFVSMSHEKSGCYLETMNKDQEVYGRPVKLCQHATWPHGCWSWWPNSTIKRHCNDCKEVLEDGWKPSQVPKALIKGGCHNIGNAEAKACRPDTHSAGYNYRWDSTTWFDSMANTLDAFTEDTMSCVNCLTKVASWALSGGIASIIGILIIMVIVWVINWIYKNFFAGTQDAGGGSGPNIYIPSS